jgi:hypothetical protein
VCSMLDGEMSGSSMLDSEIIACSMLDTEVNFVQHVR